MIIEGVSPHNIPLILHEGTLAIGPCPRPDGSLLQELALLKDKGITTVISLLTDDDQVRLGLEGEEFICRTLGLKFLRFPIPDQGIPGDTEDASAFFRQLHNRCIYGEHLYIHCMHGIGRAPMAAASVLVFLGNGPERAFRRIAELRGGIQVTQGQIDFVKGLVSQ